MGYGNLLVFYLMVCMECYVNVEKINGKDRIMGFMGILLDFVLLEVSNVFYVGYLRIYIMGRFERLTTYTISNVF
jgi:hypothetical protein